MGMQEAPLSPASFCQRRKYSFIQCIFFLWKPEKARENKEISFSILEYDRIF